MKASNSDHSCASADHFVEDDHADAAAAEAPAHDADSTTAAAARQRPSCSILTNPIKQFYRRTRTILSQLTRSEISGSLGDLGTLIPLLVALARQRSVYLAPALFWAGIANIVSGYKWDVPMCVQPMKSIAAVALAELWTAETVTAAGIATGGLIFVIGLSNLIELINVIVPPHVVSGIQIGVGLRLASRGIDWISELTWASTWDCITLAIVCSVLCLYWLRETPEKEKTDEDEDEDGEDANASGNENSGTTCIGKALDVLTCGLRPRPGQPHPVGIYLFLIGALFATIELATTDNADGQYDLPLRFFGAPVAIWAMDGVTASDWRIGFFDGAIPQIPLTTLNSVISVCALAHSLYPEKRNPNRPQGKNDAVISRRETSISVGLMNLLFVPFGGMPNCHGAGGLAGQHRLGARHGASVVFLGLCKVLLAIFFGASALTLLDAVPTSVLGVMLAIAGQELATTGFTLLVSSVEKEYEQAVAAAATAESAALEETNRIDLGNTNGNQRRRRRRVQRPKSKKLMLRRSTVIATVTTMVTIGTTKTSYGALSGWVTHLIYGDGITDFVTWVTAWWDERRRQRHDYDDDRRQDGGGDRDTSAPNTRQRQDCELALDDTISPGSSSGSSGSR